MITFKIRDHLTRPSVPTSFCLPHMEAESLVSLRPRKFY